MSTTPPMQPDPADQCRTEAARTNWTFRHVMRRRRKWFILGLLGGSVLVFLWVAGVTYILPREFLGRAKILLSMPEGNAERVIATEMALIRSEKVLYTVIEKAKLVNRWGYFMPSKVFDFMNRQLEIRHEPGTSIVMIDFCCADPDEAADLANLIAQ
jgi:capsular polysaccharide biosynthesis protein